MGLFREIKRTTLMVLDSGASKASEKSFKWFDNEMADRVVGKYYGSEVPSLREDTTGRRVINRMATIVAKLESVGITQELKEMVYYITAFDYKEEEFSFNELLVIDCLLVEIIKNRKFYDSLPLCNRELLFDAVRWVHKRLKQGLDRMEEISDILDDIIERKSSV